MKPDAKVGAAVQISAMAPPMNNAERDMTFSNPIEAETIRSQLCSCGRSLISSFGDLI
jgi:hypothetical protein